MSELSQPQHCRRVFEHLSSFFLGVTNFPINHDSRTDSHCDTVAHVQSTCQVYEILNIPSTFSVLTCVLMTSQVRKNWLLLQIKYFTVQTVRLNNCGRIVLPNSSFQNFQISLVCLIFQFRHAALCAQKGLSPAEAIPFTFALGLRAIRQNTALGTKRNVLRRTANTALSKYMG